MTVTLQIPLLTPPAAEPPRAPYVRGSETSEAAAEEIVPHLGRLQVTVLRAYYDAPIGKGLIDEEMLEITGLSPSTGRPRRIELVRLGFLRDTGYKRETKSGRMAVIYVITAAGKAFLASNPEE